MRVEEIKLAKEYKSLGKSKAKITAITHDKNKEYGLGFKRPSMIIIPGGGYSFVSKREAEPVAARFFAEGYNCYILSYSVCVKYPQPQLELACTFDYINRHKREYANNGKIYAVGFSAGGHLLGSYSLYYEDLALMINVKPQTIKPNAIILSYPVITTKEFTHKNTKEYITNNEPELIKKLSIEDWVTSDYPPTFIWATEADSCVPVKNTLVMIEALKQANINYESFIYPFLEHGASILSYDTRFDYSPYSEDEKNLRTWVDRSLDFIANLNK